MIFVHASSDGCDLLSADALQMVIAVFATVAAATWKGWIVGTEFALRKDFFSFSHVGTGGTGSSTVGLAGDREIAAFGKTATYASSLLLAPGSFSSISFSLGGGLD